MNDLATIFSVSRRKREVGPVRNKPFERFARAHLRGVVGTPPVPQLKMFLCFVFHPTLLICLLLSIFKKLLGYSISHYAHFSLLGDIPVRPFNENEDFDIFYF